MKAWIISTAQQARPNDKGHRLPVRPQLTSLSRLATTKPFSVICPVMPLMTASCSGPGPRASRFQATSCRVSTISVLIDGSLPIQGAFAPFVDEADRQHAQETHHREEAEHPDLRQADRPGKQECHFEVEDDEQDRDQIEAH